MTPSILHAKIDSKRNISSKVKKKIIVIRSHRKVGKLWKRTTNVPFPALSTSLLCLHREHFPCYSKLHHCSSIWKSKIETKFKVKKRRMKRRPQPFKSEALLCGKDQKWHKATTCTVLQLTWIYTYHLFPIFPLMMALEEPSVQLD